MTLIRGITLPMPGIDTLGAEANAEGYDFIETLVTEWSNGENRFEGRGEILCGHLHEDLLVAVGGLTLDPFAGDPEIGRIRRVYVRAAWRNQGIGRLLVTALMDEARKSFRRVRLRAESPDAARLYERMGFVPIVNPDATHILTFD